MTLLSILTTIRSLLSLWSWTYTALTTSALIHAAGQITVAIINMVRDNRHPAEESPPPSPPRRRPGRPKRTPVSNPRDGHVLGRLPWYTRLYDHLTKFPESCRQLGYLGWLLGITTAIAVTLSIYLRTPLSTPIEVRSEHTHTVTTTLIVSVTGSSAPPVETLYPGPDTPAIRQICLLTARISALTARPPGSVTLSDFFSGRSSSHQRRVKPVSSKDQALIPVRDRHQSLCDACLAQKDAGVEVQGAESERDERGDILAEIHLLWDVPGTRELYERVFFTMPEAEETGTDTENRERDRWVRERFWRVCGGWWVE